MNTKATLITFLCFLTFPSIGQDQLLGEAFSEFATTRLWEYEEITIEWTMQGSIQADFNEGLNSLLEDKPGYAESNFTAVIKKDSSLWQAYYLRAASRKQMRKLKDAERDLNSALKLHGDFYEGYVELAKVLHLRGQSQESERAINKAIKLNKTKGAAHYLKGDINLSQNQLKNAINNYKDCLAADSMFHNARIKLALLDLSAKKDLSLAIRHLDKVLVYDSLQETALLFRGILGYDMDKNQAVRDLTTIISVDPNHLMARYLRGFYATKLEDFHTAFLDFHAVIKATSTDDNNFRGKQTILDKKIDLQNSGAYTLTRVYGLPDEDALKIKQAYCQILTGDFNKSIAAIDQISNQNEEPLAVYLKAVAYEHKGDHPMAYKLYNKALLLDREIEDAYKKRGIYEQELKQWDKSIADFTEMLRLNPSAFFAYHVRGVSYFHNNQMNKAIADFSTYLKYDSTNKEIIGSRGMAYFKNEERLKAYVDFAMSDDHHMFNFGDMEKLIDSVLVAGDTTQALYSLNKITNAVTYFTEGYVQKFKICVERNDWNSIENNIGKAIRNSRAGVAKSKHSYLLTVQAMIYLRKGHREDAVKTLDEAIKSDKNNSLAYLERGKLLLATGKASKAESDFKQASSLGNEQAKQLLVSTINK